MLFAQLIKSEWQKNDQGFTLLFAALTASLLLAISLAIISISIRESQLSGVAKESQFAFYAADAGVECALYWDFAHDAFNLDPATQDIQCVGQIRTVGASSGISTFQLTFPGVPYCVSVTVERRPGPATTIRSRGSNMCDIASTRRVERAIVVTY